MESYLTRVQKVYSPTPVSKPQHLLHSKVRRKHPIRPDGEVKPAAETQWPKNAGASGDFADSAATDENLTSLTFCRLPFCHSARPPVRHTATVSEAPVGTE